jgi:release factor glutamine methyltransferase
MPSSRQIFNHILSQISETYEIKEARSIVFLLLEHTLKLSKTDILIDRNIDNDVDFTEIIQRLNQHEPIQYILGETEFCGLRFLVNPSVLIPRPETEELVQLVIANAPLLSHAILDIGTGSGCIAIALAHALPHATVSGYDISEKALETAQKNAILNGVNITFEERDILNPLTPNPLTNFQIIVSNPPYIADSEATLMQKNVLNFEPHLALFVEDQNPLLFYEKIAEFGTKHLVNKGLCFVEINERFGKETAAVFEQWGYESVEIIKDLSGKDRIVKAILL